MPCQSLKKNKETMSKEMSLLFLNVFCCPAWYPIYLHLNSYKAIVLKLFVVMNHLKMSNKSQFLQNIHKTHAISIEHGRVHGYDITGDEWKLLVSAINPALIEVCLYLYIQACLYIYAEENY